MIRPAVWVNVWVNREEIDLFSYSMYMVTPG